MRDSLFADKAKTYTHTSRGRDDDTHWREAKSQNEQTSQSSMVKYEHFGRDKKQRTTSGRHLELGWEWRWCLDGINRNERWCA